MQGVSTLSQLGMIFALFGTVVSWKASLQHVVAFSTIEAEYLEITEAVTVYRNIVDERYAVTIWTKKSVSAFE